MRTIVRRRDRTGGQSLVEFALILIPFMFLLMGVIDLGRGVATNNGVTQAAREIARATSVHPGSPLGTSPETTAVIATQRATVMGMSHPSSSISITCTDLGGDPVVTAQCSSGDFVRVEVRVAFDVLTPVLNMVSPMTLISSSHVEIE